MSHRFILSCITFCLLAVGPVSAGVYLGAGFGAAEPDVSEFTKDIFSQAFVGIELGSHLSIEAAYLDFGESESSDGLVTVEAEGISLSAVGVVPLGEMFALYGRLGLLHWDRDADVDQDTIDEIKEAYDTEDEDGFDLSFSAGVQLTLAENLAVALEWSRFEMSGFDMDTYGARVILTL